MNKPIQKQLLLNKKEYYKVHLSIINAIIPIQLTPKEIDVLAAFMSLEGDIGNDRFGTTARKIVKEEMKISSGGLGNYLKAFKKKGFIKEEGNSFSILPLLIPDGDQQLYQFKLQKIEDESD